MSDTGVTVFRTYPFVEGQKICIEDGPRAGDWEVAGVSRKRVKLRCPISGQEVEWMRFCYSVEDSAERPWPGSE